LKKDRKDPLFRLFEYCDNNWGFQNIDSQQDKLDEIMQEAVRRKDDAAIQAIRRELKALDSSVPAPFQNNPDYWDDDEFEDEYDTEEEDDLGLDGVVDEMLRSLSPQERGAFLEFATMLNNASEQELRKIQKTKPKGVPQIIFDLYLDALRARVQNQDLEPETRSRSSRPKGPNQGRLF